MLKHEVIDCERCANKIECKVNAIRNCQCSTIQLNLNELQYVSEHYGGCLCVDCLIQLKDEYHNLQIKN